MAAKLYAVLIADVVASRVQLRLRKRLAAMLADASRRHLRRNFIRLPYSVTAGDEFQTVCGDLRALPQLLLDLRILLQPLSLRIGLGIGRISDRIEPPVNRLSGEAFESARIAMNALKSGGAFKFPSLTFFVSPDAPFNETINLIYGLNDTLLAGVTRKQWNAIAAFLKSGSLDGAAKILRLDISTVSRNLKRGGFWQQTETVKAAESLILRAFQ